MPDSGLPLSSVTRPADRAARIPNRGDATKHKRDSHSHNAHHAQGAPKSPTSPHGVDLRRLPPAHLSRSRRPRSMARLRRALVGSRGMSVDRSVFGRPAGRRAPREVPGAADADPVEFLGAQFDHGLAWVHFDEGFGGLGVAAGLQRRRPATSRAGAPPSLGDYVACIRVRSRPQRGDAGAAIAIPPPDLHRRGALVSALQRARRGVRPRRTLDVGGARR